MWAVVKIGAKQYKVKEGDVIQTQRITSAKPKEKITLSEVLLFSEDDKTEIGQPHLAKVKVEAEILEEKKDRKIIIFTYKRRKGYQKKRGHRQIINLLKILKIKHSK